jgi:hypothetical protein
MSNSSSRRFPVTVTQLPVTRCEICQRTVACRPGTLSEALTEHYRRAHPNRSAFPPGKVRSPARRIAPPVPSPTAAVPNPECLRTQVRPPFGESPRA